MPSKSSKPSVSAYANLFELSPSQSTPVLLELSTKQASRRKPRDLLAQLERDKFVMPSILDQRLAHRLDGLALEAAPEFEALLLSPVAPLGSCSVVAPTAQDRTLSTTRGTEVVSDPTNVLALICAERLSRSAEALPKLCTVHQTLRAQALPPVPGYSRHFRLFVLAGMGEVGRTTVIRYPPSDITSPRRHRRAPSAVAPGAGGASPRRRLLRCRASGPSGCECHRCGSRRRAQRGEQR